jgi:hypothetical protein
MNLWLDDIRDPARHGCLGWTWVKTAQEAIAAYESGEVEKSSLDHDLGMCDACASADTDEKVQRVRESLIRMNGTASYCSCPHNGTGYDVVLWLEETGRWPTEPPRVHSANPAGAARMRQAIQRHYAK